MTIDTQAVADIIKNGTCRFWCDSEAERVALFTALDELGYQWNSGHKLLNLYQGPDCDRDGVRITVTHDDCVLYGNGRDGDEFPVSEIAAQSSEIDPSAILSMLGA